MTLWVMHVPLSADEEEAIAAREFLPLPLEDLPDLSVIRSQTEFRHLLKALHPEAPPETLTRIIERTWKIFRGVEVEDIIAVPLPVSREVAIAEVTGPYQYRVQADKSDEHAIPVKWHARRIPFSKFYRHKNILNADGPMQEVQAVEVRNIIRARLPHRYNRFAGLKWILVIFIVWRLVVYFTQKFPASM